jgi:hypothetical protein
MTQTGDRGAFLHTDRPVEVAVEVDIAADDAGREACVLLYGTTVGVKVALEPLSVLVRLRVTVLLIEGQYPIIPYSKP